MENTDRESEAFPAPGREMDKFFKALSDRTRRGILRLLRERERTVSEIVGNFHLSQPTISRHLSVLKEARLVSDERQGQHVIYRLCEDALIRSAEEFFATFRPYRLRSAASRPTSREPLDRRLSLGAIAR